MANALTVLAYPVRWWARQSLRARLTLTVTALFTFAVATGAVLLIVLQRVALTRLLDASAVKTASDIAQQVDANKATSTPEATSGGILGVQVVDANDAVIAASGVADRITPVLTVQQLTRARKGVRFEIDNPTAAGRWRVLGANAHSDTVLVITDFSRVDDNQAILIKAALIGGPLAVLLMALASYAVAALTLRPVAALRHGAADITAAGLADQRLPVPGAQDEIHRLAVTLNAMLDRIDSATARQRTFVGDAAHELRSPLASLRVQLEVAQRFADDGSADWDAVISDVMIDVERLDRLVADLLALARMDESGGLLRRSEPVLLSAMVADVVSGYAHAGVRVTASTPRPVRVTGDPDGLRRVIINLVDNAVRYARGEVTVAVIPELLAGRQVARLTVTDDGPGLPVAERERVFDRFYRIEESRAREAGGTGLGLPIVRDLARAHGGSVRLTDRPDGRAGLQAVVILPVDGPTPPPS